MITLNNETEKALWVDAMRSFGYNKWETPAADAIVMEYRLRVEKANKTTN